MYKVFPVQGGYQIFWCLSEHEKYPLNKIKVYPQHPAAYRRCKQLNDRMQKSSTSLKDSDLRDILRST